MAAKVTAVVGDITVQAVDAIVNAANRWLEIGRGVCG
ncbi:MAG TPA: O-acetyl-ADP-ribose deacetylase, partial [Chitinophagaceae bacterium]|nr:O-acetyl-ADP-ribose deacetylase [Chitinophagaceae bacterium]